jgi:lauroyl/myristoyl acyltransferase
MVERPPAPTRMPPAPLALRLKTSVWVRALLPTRLVVRRAVLKGQRLWEQNEGAREDALAAMATVVSGTSLEGSLERVAREYVIEQETDTALFWQPWSTPEIDEATERNLREALDQDRGVLLSSCHLGPYPRITRVLLDMGRRPYGVFGPWFFEPPSPDYWGRRIARWHKGARSRYVTSKGSYRTLRALLERGEWVVLFFDVPGHRPTRYLGKPAMLADGTARLAIESDALVLPTRLRRVGHRVWMDVAPPLDPRELADVEALHTALARLHEKWVLEYPAAMADPRDFGWEQGATPEAWNMPEPQAG